MADDNIINLSDHKVVSHPVEAEFEGELLDLITEYHGKITYAQVIGVLEIVKDRLTVLGRTYDFDNEDDDE